MGCVIFKGPSKRWPSGCISSFFATLQDDYFILFLCYFFPLPPFDYLTPCFMEQIRAINQEFTHLPIHKSSNLSTPSFFLKRRTRLPSYSSSDLGFAVPVSGLPEIPSLVLPDPSLPPIPSTQHFCWAASISLNTCSRVCFQKRKDPSSHCPARHRISLTRLPFRAEPLGNTPLLGFCSPSVLGTRRGLSVNSTPHAAGSGGRLPVHASSRGRPPRPSAPHCSSLSRVFVAIHSAGFSSHLTEGSPSIIRPAPPSASASLLPPFLSYSDSEGSPLLCPISLSHVSHHSPYH